MDGLTLTSLLFLGFIAYFFLAMVGLGGGLLVVPMLILIFHVPASSAIGTSLFAMTLSTLAATIGYWTAHFVDWKLAVAYNVFDIPGIILGAFLTQIVASSILELICGLTITTLAILVLTKKRRTSLADQSDHLKVNGTRNPENIKAESRQFEDREKPGRNLYSFAWSRKNVLTVALVSLLGGLITGMVGIGGGTVDTTSMILIGVPMNVAAGSSSFAMFMTNAFGVTTHISLGNISWDYAIPLGVVALVGAFLGSRLAPKLNSTLLRRILGVLALFTGIRLVFNIFLS